MHYSLNEFDAFNYEFYADSSFLLNPVHLKLVEGANSCIISILLSILQFLVYSKIREVKFYIPPPKSSFECYFLFNLGL